MTQHATIRPVPTPSPETGSVQPLAGPRDQVSLTETSSSLSEVKSLAEDKLTLPPEDDLTFLTGSKMSRLDTSRALREMREEKSLAMFASELPSSAAPESSLNHAGEAVEASTNSRAESRFSVRGIALGVLAVLVLAQGGLMAYWMLSREVAAPMPDTGSLTVTSEPTGSPVTIDGAPSGVTPLTIALKIGDHRLEVGTGVGVRTQALNITAGNNAIHVASVVTAGVPEGTGGLQIASDPPGARISIDGEARGVAPLNLSNVAVGEHAVTVRGASGEAVNRTVSVREGTVASLIVSMNTTPAFASGWLAVTSAVPLQILEQGALIGSTETPRILLPTGEHQLELVNSALGYRVTRSVRITAGQSTAFALPLPKGSLSINALPWAEVWVDGERTGETPIGNLSIAIGQHEVLFRHPELGEQRKSVTVGVQAPARIGVDMKKP